MSAITLPGDGQKVASTQNTGSEHVQHLLDMRSDDVNLPITADANGKKVQLGAALPAGTNNIGDVDVLSLPALAAGANAIGKLAANSGVDIGDVDVTSVVPGTGATALGKAAQATAGATDTAVPGLYVRKDTAADLAGGDGKYAPGQMDSTGRVRTKSTLDDGAGGDLSFAQAVVLSATPTLDTSIYASGDSLWSSVLAIANAVRSAGGTGQLVKVVITDYAAQSAPLDLLFFNASLAIAAANAAHSITDAELAAKALGHISIVAGDYISNGANSVATKLITFPYSCAATTLYIAGVTRGTPTYAAGSLVLAFHAFKD